MSSRNINYHLKETWQQKYRSTTCQNYQWIDSASSIIQYLVPYLPSDKQSQLLQLGCGSSMLCQLIANLGFSNVTAVDFSKQIIKHKKTKIKNVNFVHADFTQNFKFATDKSYYLIIDKGSLDCVFCQQDYLRKILTCLKQCYEKLNDGGKLISISLAPLKNRKFWFRNKLVPFTVEVKRFNNQFREDVRKNNLNYNKQKQQNNQWYYMYICTKGQSIQGNMNKIDWNKQGSQQIPHNQDEQKIQSNSQNEQNNNSQLQKSQDQNQQNEQNDQNKQKNQQNHDLSKDNNEQEQNYQNQNQYSNENQFQQDQNDK